MSGNAKQRLTLNNLNEPQQMRELNRQLSWIWDQLLGGLTMKSLNGETRKIIDNKVSQEIVDELGRVVAENSSQIVQTEELVQATVGRYEADLKESALEIDDVSYVLGKGYWVIGTYELSGIERGAGERIGWEVTVTPTADKNIGQRIRFYDADGGITYEQGGMRLCKKDEAAQLSHSVTIPEGAVSFDIALFDMSGETGGTDAAVRCTENRIVRWGAYVSQSVFRQEADSIMLAVNGKLGADENSAGVDTQNGILIDKNGVYVSGGEISLSTSDGSEYVNISGEGVSASSMSAPNVAMRYDGPDMIYVNPNATDTQVGTGEYVRSLQAAVSKVNGRCLDRNVGIWLIDGVTTYGDIELKGVHGGGGLTILGSNASTCILNGRLSITNCYTLIRIDDMSIITAGGDAVTVTGSPDTFFWNDVIKSSSGTGLSITMGGGALVNACVLSGSTNAGNVQLGGRGVFMDTTGSGKLSCTLGMMLASGTVPSGGAEWINTFEPNNKSSLTTDSTGGSSSATSTTAATYELAHSDYYAGGWSFTGDNDLRQGYMSGRQLYGCMWFDSLSGISGRSIKEATLRLHRDGDYGRGGSVSVYLRGLTTAYSTAMGYPSLSGDYGLIGTIQPGETLELTVPTAAITALANGSIRGLALYTGETSYHKTYSYSKNFARFDGETSGTEETKPRLTVVYG